MAGQEVVRGQQPVEYAEETEFATELAEGTEYEWIGLGVSWDVTQGAETETISYLPAFDEDNKLSKKVNVQHSEMWEADLTYHPQSFDLLEYFSGQPGGTADDPETVQFGHIDEENDQFQRMLGGAGEELTMSVDEDGSFEFDASFIFADATDWEDDDYVGEGGEHATEDTSEPHKYASLSNVTYGGESLDGALESLEVTISNDIAVVKDPDAERGSLIAALVPVDREITVDLTLTYDSFDMSSEVRDYTPKDLQFDIGTTTFTVSDVQFPEFPFTMEPEDLISDSISSDPATNITWS